MSALEGFSEAEQKANAKRVKEYFRNLTTPPDPKPRPRPLSPFSPQRVRQAEIEEAERLRLDAALQARIEAAVNKAVEERIPKTLMDIFDSEGRTSRPHWMEILKAVAEKHKIRVTELISGRRSQYIVRARWEAIWRMRNETSMSLPQIGHRVGGRDHTTVLYALRKYQELIDRNEAL
jgi:chromosomal replication initiation ATPase DnaA